MDILNNGKEITQDMMQCKPQDGSLFATEIEWHLQTSRVNDFDVFISLFFTSLSGKAAVIDNYLSDPHCSGHQTYWLQEKGFHCRFLVMTLSS